MSKMTKADREILNRLEIDTSVRDTSDRAADLRDPVTGRQGNIVDAAADGEYVAQEHAATRYWLYDEGDGSEAEQPPHLREHDYPEEIGGYPSVEEAVAGFAALIAHP